MLEKEKSIIVISTTISICIMLLTGIEKTPITNIASNQEHVKNQSEVIVDNPKLPIITMTAGETVNANKDKVNNTSESKKDQVVEAKKPIDESKNNDNSKTSDSNIVRSETELPKESPSENNDTEKTASVFKVNREDIFSELSFFDKEKLLLISTKLKVSDYKKINVLLQGDVDGTGVLTSLKILKDKLSKNDYSKIKQIFSKFINMDLVDT